MSLATGRATPNGGLGMRNRGHDLNGGEPVIHSSARFWLVALSLLLAPEVASPARGHDDNQPLPPIHLTAAQAAADNGGPVHNAGRLDATDNYRLALLKIKAHLSVARALLQIRAPGADYHLGEPIGQVFEAVEGELDERSAPLTRDTLAQLRRATDAAPGAALATIDTAAGAVDGSFAQTGAMRPSSALALSEQLLRAAVALYTEAVADNEVVDLRAYRTGRGYVTQAEALVRHSSGIKGRPGYDELLATVVLVRQAWPGIRPPPIVFDPRSVAGRLDEAVAALKVLAK